MISVSRRTDYDGLGFTVTPRRAGPHQVLGVEPGSPSEAAGLRPDDLLLSVNGCSLLGRSFARATAAILRHATRAGETTLTLEVVEPALCPVDILNVPNSEEEEESRQSESQQSRAAAAVEKKKTRDMAIFF